ncbi:MAG: MFS transporter [Myxococcales bacterium]|nr:MFS transporter [Myxococcales bacterium]
MVVTADRSSTRVVIITWYVLLMASIGALHPFFSMVLARRGMGDSAITVTLAFFPAGTLLAGPLWSAIADRMSAIARLLTIATCSAALMAVGLALSQSWLPLLLFSLGLAVSRAPVTPMVDVLTLRWLGSRPNAYGRVRAFGSAAFVVVVLTLGLAVEEQPNIGIQMSALGMLLLVPTTVLLLRQTREHHGNGGAPIPWRDFSVLLREPGMPLFWIGAILHGITLSSYDHLFSLHFERLGLAPSLTSLAITTGVGIEILVMWLGIRLLDRTSPRRLLLIAVFSGFPRWLVTGLSTEPAILIGAQALHGVGFGLWWVSGVSFLNANVRRELGNTAQSLFLATTFGIGSLLAMSLATVTVPALETGGHFLALAPLSVVSGAILWRAFRSPVFRAR